MTGVANIGTSSTNAQGLTNAFATVNKLVNISTGSTPGPALPVGASVPVAKINTLADILAGCINSAGLASMSDTTSSCGMLFTAATVNSVEPTDTITAAMNMAQHPNANTSVANNVNATSQFQPTLLSAPSDFSLVITYTGGGLATPKGIATDTGGNVWVANSGANSVTKFDALGITQTDATGYLSGTSGYTLGSLSAPVALAIDTSGNAWVANGNSTVTEIAANGSTGTLFSGGSLSSPSGVAIDASNNVWVANSGNASVTEITPGTTPVYANYTGSGIAAPSAIAINPK
jgi:streptogramin lyase